MEWRQGQFLALLDMFIDSFRGAIACGISNIGEPTLFVTW
jgi:hypothetical protein